MKPVISRDNAGLAFEGVAKGSNLLCGIVRETQPTSTKIHTS